MSMDNLTVEDEEVVHSSSPSAFSLTDMILVANVIGIIANTLILATLFRYKPNRIILNWMILGLCQSLWSLGIFWHNDFHEYIRMYIFIPFEIIAYFFCIAFGLTTNCLILMLLLKKSFKLYDDHCVVANIFAVICCLVLTLSLFIFLFHRAEFFIGLIYQIFVVAIFIICCTQWFRKTWNEEHKIYMCLATFYSIPWIFWDSMLIALYFGLDVNLIIDIILAVVEVNSVVNFCLFMKMDKLFRSRFLSVCYRNPSGNNTVDFIKENEQVL